MLTTPIAPGAYCRNDGRIVLDAAMRLQREVGSSVLYVCLRMRVTIGVGQAMPNVNI
jgi:hypothetical protein